MHYFIKTFGCAMNHSDSERLASFLEKNKFSLATKIEEADLVVLNTCGVRKAAEDRVFSTIHNLRKNKKQKQIIVMTGCIAHRADVQRSMKNKVDLFFQINDFEIFKNWILKNFLETRLPARQVGNWKLEIPQKNLNQITNKESIAYLSQKPKHTNSFAAYVPIMTGCNNFCAYCVVPYARGREVSRPADEIIAEVQNLANKGYKQITLLGQNVNSYRGNDRNPSANETGKEISFAQLLKMLDKIPGKFWLTFTSSHPKDISDELIETVAKCKKVCEAVHLPVQAGNDTVLRRMNRHYTRAHYLKLVSKIRAAYKKYKPNSLFSLSSDIIVGFPGETRSQFQDSALVMQKAKFDMVYFGQFSPRPGTAAWQMQDNISHAEKERRENVLNEILKKTALTNGKKYVSKKIEVLIEKEKDGFYFGKTRTLKNIKFPASKKALVGSFVKVKITKANSWSLEGEL